MIFKIMLGTILRFSYCRVFKQRGPFFIVMLFIKWKQTVFQREEGNLNWRSFDWPLHDIFWPQTFDFPNLYPWRYMSTQCPHYIPLRFSALYICMKAHDHILKKDGLEAEIEGQFPKSCRYFFRPGNLC